MKLSARNMRSSQFVTPLWIVVFLFTLFAQGADHISTPPGPIIHRAQLNSSGETSEDDFGDAVAIDGNTVVVGAQTVNAQRGAAYVFVKPSGGWTNMTQIAELTASDDAVHLGASVAISGDTIVVGAPYTTVNGVTQEGAVYVFVEPAGGWSDMTETAKLTGAHVDSIGQDYVGATVSIDGNTIVAGVPNVLADPPALGYGEALVYVKPAQGWANATETAVLYFPPEGYPEYGLGFGFSVAVSGNTVAVGANGCCYQGAGTIGQAYVYVEPDTGWVTTDNYNAELTGTEVGVNDDFGWSIAIDGNTVVVGSPQHDSYQVGAAYVYVEPTGGWRNMTETAELYPLFTQLGEFGTSVAINGNVIFIGAPFLEVTGGRGAAYAFVKPKGGWQSTDAYSAEVQRSAGTSLGQSVSISGATAVAGYSGTSTQNGGADVFWVSLSPSASLPTVQELDTRRVTP
jgi:hypothetical protein